MDLAASLMKIAQDRGLRDDLGGTLGPYCHQFRNRLNSLKLAIYLARRQADADLGPLWESLDRDYLAIEDQLDRVQKVCRDADLARVAIDLDLLFADRSPTWADTIRRGGGSISLVSPRDGCRTSVDIARLGAGLDDLVAWRAAARADPREIRIAWSRDDTGTSIRWCESPPSHELEGVPRAEPWRTWTLPTLARLMADLGGSIAAMEGPGWEVTMRWPG